MTLNPRPSQGRGEISHAPADGSREVRAMYKRQHYAIEHSARDSASSASSSSLDTASDADSGGPEQVDDAAWPASSHESDESSPEAEVVEVESSASVSARRAEAIRIAERKLAEAAEDVGEFEDEVDKEADGTGAAKNSGDEGEESDSEDPDSNGTVRLLSRSDGGSYVEPTDEVLAQRKVSNQWAEAVEEDEIERKLDRFEGDTVICVGGEKHVFKCRVCPKVICLNDDTMLAHLASKRHRRSMKQLAEGKLKIQLDSDGDEDEDGETHAERYARTMAAAQELVENAKKRKRDTGRQRQRNRDKVKKTDSEKSETCEKIGKNRKERRVHLHADLCAIIPGKAASSTIEHTERKRGKPSDGAVNGEFNRKKKSHRKI